MSDFKKQFCGEPKNITCGYCKFYNFGKSHWCDTKQEERSYDAKICESFTEAKQ